MRNTASAEIHNHAPSGVIVVGAILAGFGLACLAMVYVQGTIYTRESQLTRERSEYQQQQITDMQNRVDMMEARTFASEAAIRKMREWP